MNKEIRGKEKVNKSRMTREGHHIGLHFGYHWSKLMDNIRPKVQDVSECYASYFLNITFSTLSTDRSQFEGLAVDSELQKLYYTDYRWERIGEMSTDGSNHRVLYNVRGSKPRAIVLDSVNRYACILLISNSTFWGLSKLKFGADCYFPMKV